MRHDQSNRSTRSPAAPRRLRRRGVSALEAALVLPVLLVLTFGTIEFGYAIYVKHTMHNAAREGARRGVVTGRTNADVTAAVEEAMENGGLGSVAYAVTVRNTQTNAAANVSALGSGESFVVEVRTPWEEFAVFLTGLGGWIEGDLVARTTMRRE